MTLAKARRRKYKRSSMNLTERDKQILRDLYTFGTLTTEQLCTLHFPSLHRARKRLRSLWQSKLVRRIEMPVQLGEGSGQYCYTLARKGWQGIVRNATNDMPFRMHSSMSVHTIELNTFRVAITLALKLDDHCQLDTWMIDRTMKFNSAIVSEGRRFNVNIIPDAYFILSVRGRKFGYFVELDRGTADRRRVIEKLQAYVAFWKKDGGESLGIRSFRVLWVTITEHRKESVLKALLCLDRHERRDIIAVTSTALYSLTDADKLFSPIWHTVDAFGGLCSVAPLPVLHKPTLPTASSNSLVRRPDAGAR